MHDSMARRHDNSKDDDGGRSVHPSWLAMQLMKR
jgi:hypothetical protein